jgi:hypothetical protein
MEFPQTSRTVPQRCVWAEGVHVSGAHAPPASFAVVPDATHWLLTQSCPIGQPPQLMATPHESTPRLPHLPAHVFGWQLCAEGPPTAAAQTSPEGQGAPQANVLPVHGST